MMPREPLLDNDVVLKIASYSLVAEAVKVIILDEDCFPWMLSVGQFVVRTRLERSNTVSDIARAKAALERMLDTVQFVEPNSDEIAFAAELEAEAGRQGLELDSGESQLLALLAHRRFGALITGDKRAILAMATVCRDLAASRIICFEQLMAMIIDVADVESVRARVCSEPNVDRAMMACFACSSPVVGKDNVAEGLGSYMRDLDRQAPEILMPAFGLTQAGQPDPGGSASPSEGNQGSPSASLN